MLLYGATMFLSAFLLFLVQPLIGKYILPWFGGTPAVWTTCMLFFQVLLLGGYSYAHALAGRWPLRRQALVHLFLVSATVVAVLYFSIFPSAAWKPLDGQSPVLRILGLLLVSIGAPYLLLSSTAPLMQSWFSRTRPETSPYRLYALSNLGSLLAILSYPLLIEPSITLSRQASIWSWLYVAFALMCVLLSLKVMGSRVHETGANVAMGEDAGSDRARPGLSSYVLWLSLTTCSSVMLLATTSMMCQDLAVVPLLWILPLALYLLSFVLCFQHERLYWRPLFIGGLAASIAWTCYVLFGGVFVALRWQILSYSLTLFTSCMVCHGELVRMKPGSRHLTSFYLMIAGGGSLGGLLATVGAPHLLRGFWEYHIGLLATVLLTMTVLFRDRRSPLYQGRPLAVWAIWCLLLVSWVSLALLLYTRIWQSWKFYLGLPALLLLTAVLIWRDHKGSESGGRPLRVWTVWTGLGLSWIALAFVLSDHIQRSMDSSVEASRNFFGVLRVLELYKDDPEEHNLSLMHGRIEHGFQFLDREKRHWRTSYYGPASGIGLAIGYHPRRLEGENLRIGVIGLGAGALAAWGERGDYIRFYEINPEVLRLSDKYFTYRKDSPARIEVVLGDARISLERERQRGEAQKFDVIAVDAFSGDAIPVHLLTRECFQDYLYHLKEDGILAVHITNRYFDLSPVVRNLIWLGPRPDMQALWIHDLGNMTQSTDRTDWVLLTANAGFLANRNIQQTVTPWKDPTPPPRFWTDDYSDLFSLIHERINDR
jgi:hypothetical protein